MTVITYFDNKIHFKFVYNWSNNEFIRKFTHYCTDVKCTCLLKFYKFAYSRVTKNQIKS